MNVRDLTCVWSVSKCERDHEIACRTAVVHLPGAHRGGLDVTCDKSVQGTRDVQWVALHTGRQRQPLRSSILHSYKASSRPKHCSSHSHPLRLERGGPTIFTPGSHMLAHILSLGCGWYTFVGIGDCHFRENVSRRMKKRSSIAGRDGLR